LVSVMAELHAACYKTSGLLTWSFISAAD